MLTESATTLGACYKGLLAYYDYPLSTGLLESTDIMIKTMKRRAYGFRDLQSLKLKIIELHKAKYALVG